MKNRLLDLNNHLFSQLERLTDESMTPEQIEQEVKRADAVVAVSEQIIRNADLSLKAVTLVANHGDELHAEVRKRPLTLAHNDIHSENIFLPTPEGRQLAIIDWQSLTFTRHGTTDVTRVIYGSIMGSYNVEDFGPGRIKRLEQGEIDKRFREFEEIGRF